MIMSCYIKKKRGLCMREKLQELDEAIAEKKAFYQTLVEVINEVEKMIQDKQYRKLWAFKMPLYDGFNYKIIEVQERNQSEQNACPYQHNKELCETLMDYKVETLTYQNQKVSRILQKYNQLACLLFALQQYDKKKYCIKPYMLLSLDQKTDYRIGYYATNDLIVYEGKCDTLFIFYMLESTQVSIETISLMYRSYNDAMDGTSLKTNDTAELWLEISESCLLETIYETILKCVQEIIIYLRRHGKKIAGCFIALKEVYNKIDSTTFKEVEALGYQTIGKVIRYQFIENQLLIWQYNSKK